MKKMMVLIIGPALAALALAITGCQALNGAVESAKDKNLAYGSDMWGGEIETALVSSDNPLPNITLWFGRCKRWYISVKQDSVCDGLAKVVKASNSTLSVSAGSSGVSIANAPSTGETVIEKNQ